MRAVDARGTDYAHGRDGRGQRNGYRPGSLKTAEGRIEYAVPQVRGFEGWRSAVRDALKGRTEELERLAIEMWARGLSVRDIEAAFVDEGGRCVLSKSAVSGTLRFGRRGVHETGATPT